MPFTLVPALPHIVVCTTIVFTLVPVSGAYARFAVRDGTQYLWHGALRHIAQTPEAAPPTSVSTDALNQNATVPSSPAPTGSPGTDPTSPAGTEPSAPPPGAPAVDHDNDHDHDHDGDEHDHESEETASLDADTESDEHSDEDHSGHDHGPSEEDDDLDNLDLRIIAVFAILAGGLIGCMIPLLVPPLRKLDSPSGRILRCFSGGVILALALIHVLPEAEEALTTVTADLTNFPVAGCVIIGGVMIMVVAEVLVQSVAQRMAHEAPPLPQHKQMDEPAAERVDDLVVHPHVHPNGAVHNHMHVRTPSDLGWSPQEETKDPGTSSVRRQVIAIIMELGCVFHSFVIGLALGTTTTSRSYAISTMTALSFHQLLEGMALGSVVCVAGFSNFKALSMLLVYSLTTPTGVAVGIGVSSVYSADAHNELVISGTFNAISAGMLLYNSIYQLLGEEFSRQDLYGKGLGWLKALMVLFACAGAVSMAIIGMWA